MTKSAQIPLHPTEKPHKQSAGRHCSRSLLLLAGFLLASQAMAAGSAVWSSTNIEYLNGNSYESIFFNPSTGKLDSTKESASVITIEHVNEWKYGDNFLFVDITNPERNDPGIPTSYYGELSPRFSLGKLSGKGTGTGLIKDVLITTTAEIGQGFHNNLYGVAVDLNLPNTPVFQINYYVRKEIAQGSDTGSQVTLVWVKPFTIGNLSFSFDGFFDYAWDLGTKENNIITAPRLLLDLGNFWGSPGQLQVGVEYQMWRNKYGIDGIDENVAQAMIKWIW